MNQQEPRLAGRLVEPPKPNTNPSAQVQNRAEQGIIKLARIIGRQIAREEFTNRMARTADDNSLA